MVERQVGGHLPPELQVLLHPGALVAHPGGRTLLPVPVALLEPQELPAEQIVLGLDLFQPAFGEIGLVLAGSLADLHQEVLELPGRALGHLHRQFGRTGFRGQREQARFHVPLDHQDGLQRADPPVQGLDPQVVQQGAPHRDHRPPAGEPLQPDPVVVAAGEQVLGHAPALQDIGVDDGGSVLPAARGLGGGGGSPDPGVQRGPAAALAGIGQDPDFGFVVVRQEQGQHRRHGPGGEGERQRQPEAVPPGLALGQEGGEGRHGGHR